ncbi:hypothetical protein K491DRAFT_636196 [Lophiostoma macrostomum CBS 122681]|uniref:Uncharacterized protein n=1 Tax=Lophiostoma macrostomum CBS 122681 TaxID=1314788 RepID=A0A6A6SX61_9PLEO|nr:hypothetical protein K491DRAFT_636196 [Lophiostoma macrostomum CBS 122681]
MAPGGTKSSKPIFKTSSPFTETKWPEIPPEHQEVILELLCNLLEPIGTHRQNTHASVGKKRKRASTKHPDSTTEPSPPPPDISKHILVGLNSCTQHLSRLAADRAPANLAPQQSGAKSNAADVVPNAQTPLSILILPHPNPSSSLAHAHLPTLVYLSSLPSASSQPSLPPAPATSSPHQPEPQPTRLIPLRTTSESPLASALHIPRVSAIGILEGAPGADALVEYVRSNVGVVECKWVEESLAAEWKGVKTSVQMG